MALICAMILENSAFCSLKMILFLWIQIHQQVACQKIYFKTLFLIPFRRSPICKYNWEICFGRVKLSPNQHSTVYQTFEEKGHERNSWLLSSKALLQKTQEFCSGTTTTPLLFSCWCVGNRSSNARTYEGTTEFQKCLIHVGGESTPMPCCWWLMRKLYAEATEKEFELSCFQHHLSGQFGCNCTSRSLSIRVAKKSSSQLKSLRLQHPDEDWFSTINSSISAAETSMWSEI